MLLSEMTLLWCNPYRWGAPRRMNIVDMAPVHEKIQLEMHGTTHLRDLKKMMNACELACFEQYFCKTMLSTKVPVYILAVRQQMPPDSRRYRNASRYNSRHHYKDEHWVVAKISPAVLREDCAYMFLLPIKRESELLSETDYTDLSHFMKTHPWRSR